MTILYCLWVLQYEVNNSRLTIIIIIVYIYIYIYIYICSLKVILNMVLIMDSITTF